MRVSSAAAATLMILALTGCGVDNGQGFGAQGPGESSQDRTSPPEPVASPVKSPETSDETPDGLLEEASLDRTTDLSQSEEGRIDAENFAVSFAQLMVDTREDRDQEALVDDLTSDQLPTQVREILLSNYRHMHESGAGRHIDSSYPALVRSEFAGTAEAPTRVNVELIAAAGNDWNDSLAVIRMRVDVVREGDRWQVIGYGGPDSMGGGIEKPRDVLNELEGTGWRRIPQ
ncbi:hypothetical protein [Nocardioides campestrisoli]|uniref:hypothetical protein n=1 Tax=Nocardioides campestrisoli TaxID=2736757 RepID=UPI0015E79DF7|nr:hypothetical protein [Nocardioides campestrisoli]